MKKLWVGGAVTLVLGVALANALVVTQTRKATSEQAGITILAGEVELPSDGRWVVREPDPGSGPLVQLFLMPANLDGQAQGADEGRRMQEIQRQQKVKQAQYPLHQFYWPCAEHAKLHNGTGPATLDEIEFKNDHQGAQKKSLLDSWQRGPWLGEPKIDPPHYFLIPNVQLTAADGKPLTTTPTPLAFELHPYVDDGKHWVTFSDGQVRRMAIDRELAKKYGLTIAPVLPATPATPAAAPVKPAVASYHVYGLLRDAAGQRAQLTLEDMATGKTLPCTWTLASSQALAGPEAENVLEQWRQTRRAVWMQAAQGEAPILRAWLMLTATPYGSVHTPGPTARFLEPEFAARQTGRGPRHSTTMFQVLGGRAAMQETLQLDALRTPQNASVAAATTVPVATIEGVAVKSHPFQEMLAGKEGGRLALADSAPVDRLFVYWAKPDTLLGYLDDGAGFLSRLGSMSAGNSIRYDLKARYLAKLGMDDAWLRLILKSGLVTELGMVLPDLFLIDGTDVTVMARIPNLALFQPFLATLGVAGLKDGAVITQSLKGGGSAYWSFSGDLLLISTCRSELEGVLTRRRNQGTDSLGQSAEFRYMLTQLGPDKQTRAYVYFSDPFIRRLVGPAVKIGQFRRLTARAKLELITAAALLYKLDAHPEPPTLALLARHGYLSQEFAAGGFTLKPDLSAESAEWGSHLHPVTLATRPIESATADEVAAYKTYVENYSRYWRQFFDPIAIRLNETENGSLELTTFILPLLDSTVYNTLKEVLVTREKGTPLPVPVIQPPAVLSLSLNLADESWTKVSTGLAEFLVRYTGLDSKLLDEFGPGVHLFVNDSDPILALGSGDLLGAFGGDIASLGGGRSEMLAIPIALSVLTRPCQLFVAVNNPDNVKAILRRGVVRRAEPGRDFIGMQTSLTQYPGRDAWLLDIGVFGMIKLRFGVEVVDQYLVISNVPWSQQVQMTARPPAALNGAAIALNPGAVEKQLAALFTAAAEQQRTAAMRGIGYLYPLMLGEKRTPEQATAVHASLFGFAPVHPGTGKWLWQDGRLASDTFGRPDRPVQPEYKVGDRSFGLCRDLQSINVSMQLEDTGLRTICRWKRSSPAP